MTAVGFKMDQKKEPPCFVMGASVLTAVAIIPYMQKELQQLKGSSL
jgi:hypothetical protein